MKQKIREFSKMANGGWQPFVAAMALIFILGFAPAMVSAQGRAQGGAASAGFNSPLPGHGDVLDGIVDMDELMADALGITVDELEAAQEEGIRIDELIDELGLDADTVRQAVEDAFEAAIEQAVTDGELTEEEAEAILSGPARSEGRPAQGGEMNNPLDGIVDRNELLADALGITADELEAYMEAGTRIDELIDELGLDADTVREAVEEAFEAAIEQAVTDGELTEEEAEAILNGPADQGGPGGPGGQGGQGGPGGRGGEMPAPGDDASVSGETTGQPMRGPGAGGPGGRR